MNLRIPGPTPLPPEVMAAMGRPMIDHRSAEFSALLRRCIAGLKAIAQTNGEVLLLSCSGTGGLETAVANLFSPGDVLLSCPIGVFGKRLADIARTYGCAVEVLETPLGSALDPAALDARLQADPELKIRGVLFAHNEPSTGSQNDMAAPAPGVRAHAPVTVVDSVRGLGATPFEMDAHRHGVAVYASEH